jgi:hypothetical protein
LEGEPAQSLDSLLVEDAPSPQDDPLEPLPRYSRLARLAIIAGSAGSLWALIWWLASDKT